MKKVKKWFIKGLKWQKKGKKCPRKAQKGHETVEIRHPNSSNEVRKMPENEPNQCKITHCALVQITFCLSNKNQELDQFAPRKKLIIVQQQFFMCHTLHAFWII